MHIYDFQTLEMNMMEQTKSLKTILSKLQYPDDAKVIVPYAGDCAAVDAEFARKQAQRP